MKPEARSTALLGVTRSQAKMYEYDIPEKYHIRITQNPARLFTLAIALLGDFASKVNRGVTKPEELEELKKSLIFSSRFFDAYLQSKLDENLDPYVILLGSASYYLSDLPGSSKVLAKKLGDECPDLDGEGLEDILLWLLQGDLDTYFEDSDGPFSNHIDSISQTLVKHFESGDGVEELIKLSLELRRDTYNYGTPRQLLLGDVIATVIAKKVYNSVWEAIPRYSNLSSDLWQNAIKKDSFIKEFWPAQHLLGNSGVLLGESAVIQMPTSAGKTKATEIIIRSAFLAERASLAVIVAPFRALCHEIKNSFLSTFQNEPVIIDEFTDVLQNDFEISNTDNKNRILVVTPEKLLYAIRRSPELANRISLLILDEGHQFDSGTRGVTYELLLTSLKLLLSTDVQKILISAVISNATALGEWLNGTDARIISGTGLLPTYRSLGFSSWFGQRGSIEFVSNEDTDKREFFVPQVIEGINLGRKPREQKDRIFPEKSDGQAIALYLGLRLVSKGSVAIFCGRKDTASNICKSVVDKIQRGLELPFPVNFSDKEEIQKLHYLHLQNLGADAAVTISSQNGIFCHHGNTPHGIRLAIEYAMREQLIRFVVCTSTLAQGVNLPIRYLIISGIYQGRERIKVRDFHNLIGRVGRAGMHTEGSVLFADPNIFDARHSRRGSWRWREVKKLLDPGNSEPCISTLLSLFEPYQSDDEAYHIKMEPLEFVKEYILNPEQIADYPEQLAKEFGDDNFTRSGIEQQIAWKINLISAIESFLMANWDTKDGVLSEEAIVHLAESTLAYFLADEEKQKNIRELFLLLGNNISQKIDTPAKRKVYGRTLYGVRDGQEIDDWVQTNIHELSSAETDSELLNVIWPILYKYVHNNTFKKCNKPDILKEILLSWIQGKPFYELFQMLVDGNAKLIWGTRFRDFNIDHIVTICEGGFAFDGTLLIGAVCEYIEQLEVDDYNSLHGRLQTFQKKIKYGLPNYTSINIYELGFRDRVIVKELAEGMEELDRDTIKFILKNSQDRVSKILKHYPTYFQSEVYENFT